jgi:hypothetical protein
MEVAYCEAEEVVGTATEEGDLITDRCLYSHMTLHYYFNYFVKVSANEIIALFSIALCALLNTCDQQYNYEKQISFCTHDRSILPLDHLVHL